MKVALNIGYKQLIEIIRQLPADDISRLKAEIDRILSKDHSGAEDGWESFLIDGPVMSDEQYCAFRKNREYFNRWH